MPEDDGASAEEIDLKTATQPTKNGSFFKLSLGFLPYLQLIQSVLARVPLRFSLSACQHLVARVAEIVHP